MMKKANKLTNEIFSKYEQLIREEFVDSLEYLTTQSRNEWLDETQDQIHMSVEGAIFHERQLDGESPEGQALLTELLDVEWDLIVDHLLSE